jgi:hypothetical protein
MMILSRVWYVLLGLAVAVALYVLYIAAGEYDRQATHALKEGLASDSQTVEWALKIDARHRLDALLAGSVDTTLQQALVAVLNSKDARLPDKSKTDAKKALGSVRDAIPTDWRADALFAVDRDGRLVAQLGYDAAAGSDEFELGGYPAVNDALHGWLRDDIWVLGSKLYVVVARPIEYDATQRPAGAIVGLKEINNRFADELAKRTRTNVAFYAAGHRLAGGVGADGFDAEKLDAIGNDLKNLDEKSYHDGRTEARMISADLGALYGRLPGDAWVLGGGFAVARAKTALLGPMGFLNNADDKDKANVPWPVLAAVALLAALIGMGLTFLEHGVPLRELLTQSERLKTGASDNLQVARFRGAYRLAAQAMNEGIERAIEKAGGVSRKPTDLESILGPTPAQPAMSAFSLPKADDSVQAAPAATPLAAPPLSPPAPPVAPPAPSSSGALLAPVVVPSPGKPVAPPVPAVAMAAESNAGNATKLRTPAATVARPAPPLPSGPKLSSGTAAGLSAVRFGPPPLTTPQLTDIDEDEATMVASVPPDVMAQAGAKASDENAEWLTVYQEFIRVKRQCGEPTDGLTFEKFSLTLRKNRDQLVERHKCKRIKFSVYIKEGRASLKATPTKE